MFGAQIGSSSGTEVTCKSSEILFNQVLIRVVILVGTTGSQKVKKAPDVHVKIKLV